MTVKKTKRKTQAERREDAETGLIRAALGLIAKKGYDGFSLADVGEAAGYSRGLPAHYFKQKENLLAEVARYTIERYKTAFNIEPGHETGLAYVEDLVRRYSQSSTIEKKALFILLAQASVRKVLLKTVHQLNAVGQTEIRQHLIAGIEAGRINPDIDPDPVAWVIYFFMRGMLSFLVLEPQVDSAKVADEFIRMLDAWLVPPAA